MKRSLPLLILIVCSFSCEDEAALIPDNFDWCTVPDVAENCFIATKEDEWASLDAFRDYLIGDWKVRAEAIPNQVALPICENSSDDFNFSFSNDGIYNYRLPGGETGATNYSVVLNTCITAPCSFSIAYEDDSLDFYPRFHWFCDGGIAWYDYRPVDGGMAVYQKQ